MMALIGTNQIPIDRVLYVVQEWEQIPCPVDPLNEGTVLIAAADPAQPEV